MPLPDKQTVPPEPRLHTLQVARTARVATLGTPAAAASWWVVLHGYGQLAADFVSAFAPLVSPDRCVVAPEGLSRFYVDGMDEHEQVGASWMTRAAREAEVADYVSALDATVRHLADDAPPALHVLGFSQGAATASRWALLGDTAIDQLVLWGGAPAHDLDLAEHADALCALDLTLVAGTDDPHVTDERWAAMRRRLQTHDIPATTHTFEGGHRIDPAPLRALVAS
ncbi:alpha/beta hydrolase [Salinibacter altiplanensis]|uniref:alpha/beta hydrolase n=1 Tax=Salinibacter altiplanensis TaxID=1803181 RepID=UPI001F3F2529|nr:dienelactone hydrolase family protein [Salinibacter altiplanensis]